MDYYFHDTFNEKELQKLCLSEGQTVLRAAEILSQIIEIKYHSALFYHFNEMVDTAVEFLTQLIPFIQTYRSRRKTEALDTLQKFMVDDIQLLVKKRRLKLDDSHEVQLEKQVYSVCHINQYIVADFCIGNKYIFVLGVDWSKVFSHALNPPHVTMQSVMTALGHPVKHTTFKDVIALKALQFNTLRVYKLSIECRIFIYLHWTVDIVTASVIS